MCGYGSNMTCHGRNQTHQSYSGGCVCSGRDVPAQVGVHCCALYMLGGVYQVR